MPPLFYILSPNPTLASALLLHIVELSATLLLHIVTKLPPNTIQSSSTSSTAMVREEMKTVAFMALMALIVLSAGVSFWYFPAGFVVF